MANIDLSKVGIILPKVGISVGIGVIDEVLERQDDSKGRTDFKRWSNWARLLLAVGGWGMVAVGPSQYATWAETTAIAATPLLTKGVAKVAMKQLTGESRQFGTRFAPRRTEAGAGTQDWAPEKSGGSYRPL